MYLVKMSIFTRKFYLNYFKIDRKRRKFYLLWHSFREAMDTVQNKRNQKNKQTNKSRPKRKFKGTGKIYQNNNLILRKLLTDDFSQKDLYI